jgi:hypothetical protein
MTSPRCLFVRPDACKGWLHRHPSLMRQLRRKSCHTLCLCFSHPVDEAMPHHSCLFPAVRSPRFWLCERNRWILRDARGLGIARPRECTRLVIARSPCSPLHSCSATAVKRIVGSALHCNIEEQCPWTSCLSNGPVSNAERHSCRNDAAETPRGLSRRGRGLVCAGWWSANVPFRGSGLVIPVGPRMGSEFRRASPA